MLVRSWNLYHGNTLPTQRAAYLDEMVRLASEGAEILCLQEVPAWALGRFTVGDVAARPAIGVVPIPGELGRILTAPNHGLLRSAFAGQGNAIQVSPRLRVLDHKVLTLNTRRFRRTQARALGLGVLARLAWAKERRIVQVARLARPDRQTLVVANMHCTSFPADDRLPDAELLRGAWFATSIAAPDDVIILAGDFNVGVARSRTLAELTGEEWGFSAPGPGIDHVLVKGAAATPIRVWPEDRRRRGGFLLSDHAPVEVELNLGAGEAGTNRVPV